MKKRKFLRWAGYFIIIGSLIWFIVIPAVQEEWMHELLRGAIPNILVAFICFALGFLAAAICTSAGRGDRIIELKRRNEL